MATFMRKHNLTGHDFGAGVVAYDSNLPAPTKWAKEHLLVALAGTTEAKTAIQVNLLDRIGVSSRRLRKMQEKAEGQDSKPQRSRLGDGPIWSVRRIPGTGDELRNLMFRTFARGT